MSNIPHIETIFILPAMPMQKVFSVVHQVLLENYFEVEHQYGFAYLDDIEDEEEEVIFENELLSIDTKKEVKIIVERLQNHPSGGALMYSAIKGVYEDEQNPDYTPYHFIISYQSFDFKTIEGLLMTVREDNFNYFSEVFDQVCFQIYQKLEVKAALRRQEVDELVNGDEVIQYFLAGTLEENQYETGVLTHLYQS